MNHVFYVRAVIVPGGVAHAEKSAIGGVYVIMHARIIGHPAFASGCRTAPSFKITLSFHSVLLL